MQEAILATEAGPDESDQVDKSEEPPIAIAELSPGAKAEVPLHVQQYQAPIPIAEFQSKNESAISLQQQEEKEVLPAENHEHQAAGQ